MLATKVNEGVMLPCQRHRFNIPADIVYLNCAYTSPLLKDAELAGLNAVEAKRTPWIITSEDFFANLETARELFAKLIVCKSDDVAIIPAVSYGVALAARNLPLQQGQVIIVLDDQFPSNVYSWRKLASRKGASLSTVQRPANNNWTSAVLETIGEKTGVVAVPNCHWTDGTLLDLSQIGAKCRSVGASLVVDGTQSLGAMPFSVGEIQADFVIATAHKWLLGPYSFGFCYVAPTWQGGVPLEENWLNRAGSEDFAGLVDYRDEYRPGARRFDVGEASNFILSPIAVAALRQILDWKVENIAESLRSKTNLIAARAKELGLRVADAQTRSPHLLGLSMRNGLPKDLSSLFAREKVYVSVRGNSIRVSPHLYNTEEDLDRFFEVLQKVV
jgi:selenocysteine lyase/cysteine desulfurase